jgi:hypothetical protein
VGADAAGIGPDNQSKNDPRRISDWDLDRRGALAFGVVRTAPAPRRNSPLLVLRYHDATRIGAREMAEPVQVIEDGKEIVAPAEEAVS